MLIRFILSFFRARQIKQQQLKIRENFVNILQEYGEDSGEVDAYFGAYPELKTNFQKSIDVENMLHQEIKNNTPTSEIMGLLDKILAGNRG